MSVATRPLGIADLPLIALTGRAPYKNHAVTVEHASSSAARRPGLARLLRTSLQPGGRQVWISRDGLSLLGLAAVRPRSGPSAWEIDALVLGLRSEAFALDLLERCIATAGARGAHRLFLRLPAASDLIVAARRQGFSAAGGETLLVDTAATGAPTRDASGWRQRSRADDQHLFQIFCTTVPQETRWQTALTPAEWRAALDPMGRGAQEWLRDHADGPALLRLRLHDHGIRATLHAQDRADLARDAVAALRHWAHQRRPACRLEVLLPDHLPLVANTFRDLGFQDLARYELSARPIAQRTQRLQLAERSVEGTVRPVIQ